MKLQGSGEDIAFDWGNSADDPGEAKSEHLRRRTRSAVCGCSIWLGLNKSSNLIAQVERWGQELAWQTRKIEKRLDDSYVGKHNLLALLMQEETCRELLERVAACVGRRASCIYTCCQRTTTSPAFIFTAGTGTSTIISRAILQRKHSRYGRRFHFQKNRCERFWRRCGPMRHNHEWQSRIKTVEREYMSMRQAADRFRHSAHYDPNILLEGFATPRNCLGVTESGGDIRHTKYICSQNLKLKQGNTGMRHGTRIQEQLTY